MRSQSKLTIGTTEKLLGWDLKVVLKLNYAKKSSQIMLFNFKTYPSTIEDKYILSVLFTFLGNLVKGQLISKWFFEVVDFLQKTNENNSHSSKNEFIRSFFGGNR